MHLLIQKGADVDARDTEGASPLDDAVWRGAIDAVAILLAHGAKLDATDTQTGATPVNEAAYRGNTEMLRYLLRFHPDLGAADKKGRTPIENAIRERKENAALLLSGAEPPELLNTTRMNTLLEAAVQHDEGILVSALLDHGASRDQPFPSGYPPLDAAAFAGAVNTVQVLLDRGADPNAAAKDRSTPLEDAAIRGSDGIVALLLDHGAQVNHVNSAAGTTPIYSAASAGRLSTVKLLLDRGANSSLCGTNRKTPLQAAIDNGHEDIAREITSRRGAATCP